MTKESDRFEELYSNIYGFYNDRDDIILNEMLSIYRALKLQIVNQADAVQKDKLQYYEKKIKTLNYTIRTYETLDREYNDKIEKLEQQLIEFKQDHDAISNYRTQFVEYQEKIQELQKENDALKEQLDNLIHGINNKIDPYGDDE